MEDSKLTPKAEDQASEQVLRSKYSLKFSNTKQEKEFQQVILSNIANTLGINHREKSKSFIYTFISTMGLYAANYLASYLSSNLSMSAFLFEFIIIILSTAVTTIILYFYLITDKNSRFKSILLISSYTITSLIISLNIAFTSSKIFLSDSANNFDSILGLIPLIHTSKFTIFNTYLKYLLFNLLISITYIVLTLVSQANTQKTVIEFLFLLLVTLIESHSFYTQEEFARDKFLAVSNAIFPDSQSFKHSAPKTDIEEITKILKETVQLIPLIKQKEKISYYAEKLFDNITKVIHLLGNRQSVYSLDLEALENGFDDQDKKFIEETCGLPRRTVVHKSTKFIVRKTVDVIKTYEIEELIGVLKRIGKEWNFDTFFLRDLTKNQTLYSVGCFCMQRFRLDSLFSIKALVYEEFFRTLESKYRPNPYHNSTHSADVLASFMFIITQTQFTEFIQDYEILAIVVSVLGHDVGHQGLTNRFLVNSKDPLSITYNDSSVLENMHSASIFEIMQDPSKNILAYLDTNLYRVVRGLIIEIVLATDMAKHFDLVGKFKAKLNCTDIILTNPDQRLEVFKIIGKASDIGHAAKDTELHKTWTSLLCEEFYAQGDKEKELSLPVSMYCDRENTDLPKSQIGFIANIVSPIFESLEMCFGSEAVRINCIEQLEKNTHMWETQSKKKRLMTHGAETSEGQSISKGRNETTGSFKNRVYQGSLGITK